MRQKEHIWIGYYLHTLLLFTKILCRLQEKLEPIVVGG